MPQTASINISKSTRDKLRRYVKSMDAKIGAVADRIISERLASSVTNQEAAPTVAQPPNHTPKPN